MKGNTIDECRSLKDKIQALIDNKIIVAKEPSSNVRNNSLLDHEGGGVHMIEIEDDWDPKGSIDLITEGEDTVESYDGWRMFFNGAANFKGVGIGVVLVSKICQHYPMSAKLRFPCTNSMAEYEACIMGLKMASDMNIQELLVIGDSNLLIHQELRKRFTKTEFQHVTRIQNKFADDLATLSSMIQHPDKNFIDPIPVKIYDQPAYCAHVEEEVGGKTWFHDIKEYLAKGEYLEFANPIQKHTL
ncbi:uncharacterized protein [Nicotiana sylvestris]|uniref:uncharacterized protein n=1 Tax=Nicotiana sylvestris TaxID=4096 RepID=UPI00388C4F26